MFLSAKIKMGIWRLADKSAMSAIPFAKLPFLPAGLVVRSSIRPVRESQVFYKYKIQWNYVHYVDNDINTSDISRDILHIIN